MTADPAWSTAVPDWRDRIRQGRSLIPEHLPYDRGMGDHCLQVFKAMRVPDLPGQPTHGEVCRDWVFDFVWAVFATYNSEEAHRYIREFFLLVPKKNTKTSISAGIILTAAVVNEVPNTEMLLIAPTIKIAERAFKQAVGIVECTQGYSEVFAFNEHEQKLWRKDTKCPGTVISVKSADKETVTGSKAQYILVDETHVFGGKAQAKGVFLEARGGLSSPTARGFLLQITTQSKEAPTGVFKSELQKARDVRDGKLQLPVLPVLYELPEDLVEDERWKAPEVWPLVNPNLGLSVDQAYLADQLAAAELEGQEDLQLFASQHLNVEIGTQQWGTGWRAQLYWDDAVDPTLTLASLLERSDVVTVGVDGGGEDDLLGFFVLGREQTTRRWLGWGRVWAQPGVLERRKSIASKLEDLRKADEITIVPEDNPFQHVEDVVRHCEEIRDAGLLPAEGGIGLDLAGLPELEDSLVSAHFEPPQLVGVSQGYKLQPAVKSVPLRLKSGRMIVAEQEVMSWTVGNAKVELKGNNEYITKQTAGAAKIDPVIALLNAAMLMFRNPVAHQTTIHIPDNYEVAA